MAAGLLLKTTVPIHSIELVDEQRACEAAVVKAAAVQRERERQHLAQACEALSKAAAELESYRATLFSSHREQIVRLSLEIAAKILAKEISERNYAIEKIVLSALESAPAGKQMTIRLHPEDAKAFEKAAAEQGLYLPPHTAIAADRSVNPAECIIESESGMVDSLIDEHLRQIGEALLGTGEATQ